MTATNGAGDKVQDVAQEVGQELKEFGREVRGKAEDARKEVVKQLHNAADKIRSEAREATQDKEALHAADEVAKGLEKAATYLNSRSVDQFGNEATRVVRKNPMRAIFVAFIIGLVLGLALRGDDK